MKVGGAVLTPAVASDVKQLECSAESGASQLQDSSSSREIKPPLFEFCEIQLQSASSTIAENLA